jgi:hypothetical protein
MDDGTVHKIKLEAQRLKEKIKNRPLSPFSLEL